MPGTLGRLSTFTPRSFASPSGESAAPSMSVDHARQIADRAVAVQNPGFSLPASP